MGALREWYATILSNSEIIPPLTFRSQQLEEPVRTKSSKIVSVARKSRQT